MRDIYTVIGWVAMLAMPAAAAANFGLAAYESLEPRAAAWFALGVGAATAVGLEAVGVLLGHTAVEFHARRDRRWLLALAGLGAYVAIGTIELWGIRFSQFVPLLAALSYGAVGLRSNVQAATADERAERADEREFARRVKLEELRMKHEQKLARISASTVPALSQREPADSGHEPAPARYECEDCGRPFGTVQALNAHGRFCAGKQPVPSANGRN